MMLPQYLLSILAFTDAAAAVAVGGRGTGRVVAAREEASTPKSGCLLPEMYQSASKFTGLEEGTPGIRPGLSPSKTDADNFINFCSGSTVTNGRQVTGGSCNPIPMGRIPAVNKMPSAIIWEPGHGARVPANKTIHVTVAVRNVEAGYLVNPSVSYYTAPQDLNGDGLILGHLHITVQRLEGGLASRSPPDPTAFSYFKGIDEPATAAGELFTSVEGGLPAGAYRICTMMSARNHQPVVMPVANRGAQDDCVRFEVV